MGVFHKNRFYALFYVFGYLVFVFTLLSFYISLSLLFGLSVASRDFMDLCLSISLSASAALPLLPAPP
ncbi:hypothetical protein LXA25_18850, partial [Erwinia amylovora]|uniref:hypothetical protein n=1 Tax=Erwinia amylovora TaxID=552 RepID=UPI0020BDCDB5